MSYLFPVNINDELLEEFIYELQQQHESIERVAIHLETQPCNRQLINELRDHFTHLLYSSTKLDLIPISESLADTIIAIDLLITFGVYPKVMSEFILVVVDRILLLARDTERHKSIDMRKSQHILVALQHIILVKDAQLLEAGINQAIKALALKTEDDAGLSASDSNTDISLFDDIELFSDTENTQPIAPASNIEILVPDNIHNPILQARDEIKSFIKNHPINLLGVISDKVMPFAEAHTNFLMELCVGINRMAGGPINAQGLMAGICVHDIGLASIPHILNKTQRLSEAELCEIRKHPVVGANLIESLNSEISAKDTVLHHHERVDGTGYPHGLKKDEISDGGKLLAIVDAFHGMTESRPYKKYPRSMLRAVAEINSCSGTQFDNHWVKLFNQFMRKFWLPMRKDKLFHPQDTTVSKERQIETKNGLTTEYDPATCALFIFMPIDTSGFTRATLIKAYNMTLPIDKIYIDFRQADSIDSNTLAALLELRQTTNLKRSNIYLINPNQEIMNALLSTGFDNLFTIR